MIEFYPQIKWVHIAAVLASGTIFLLRGLAVQADARWPMAAPVRYLSYGIDTVLLTAALMLLAILPGAIYANGWLTVKLTLLVAYIVLGTIALKRGRTRGVRLGSFVAALLVYGSIIAIARLHHPLGPLWVLVR
jgi:uncharacterized membrane protein SirB2